MKEGDIGNYDWRSVESCDKIKCEEFRCHPGGFLFLGLLFIVAFIVAFLLCEQSLEKNFKEMCD